jgi:hypothetical protein
MHLVNQLVGSIITAMPKKQLLTITEFAKMGGRATLRKYGKRQLREWAKLGGRPRKVRAK